MPVVTDDTLSDLLYAPKCEFEDLADMPHNTRVTLQGRVERVSSCSTLHIRSMLFLEIMSLFSL